MKALLFYTFQIFSIAESSNILFFHTSGTASHRTAIWPLAEKLADSGHDITYVFPLSRRPGSHPKIKELIPSKAVAGVEHHVGEFDINFRLNNTVNEWLAEAFKMVPQFCEAFYASPEIQEWLSTPGLHFDLIIMDGGYGQCAYGLVHKFKAKHIIFNLMTLPWLWDSFGIAPETSTVPECMFNQKYAAAGGYQAMEASARKHLKLEDMPSYQEIEAETSLVLHNTFFIEDYPMSLPPMFVSFSGLLCSKKEVQRRKSIPEELRVFIEDHKSDGFVYVSFGSSISMSGMPDELRKQFMDAFAAFPKLRFLWRWTGPVPKDLPKNVHMQPWFPQTDILAHPKVKAFITQAGRPSSQEALCYGVPMISFPIFADQDNNADRLESLGVSISLDINTVTSEELTDAIEQVIGNEKYKKRVRELSRMYRDRPMDPLENVFYWVEYVLKYDTSLLRPLGMQQTWWQRRLLDVYALLLGIIVVLVVIGAFILKFAVKLIIRCVFGTGIKKQKSD